MDDMNEETKKTIREIQAKLIKIDSGIPVFFNIVQFQKMGLVYGTDKHGKDSCGNEIVIKTIWHLTDKAKQYIRVAI